MRTVTARLTAVLTLTAAAVTGSISSAHASEPAGDNTCEHLIAGHPVTGWTIRCLDPEQLPDHAQGVTDFQARTVVIADDLDRATTLAAFGHELAHVEDADHLTDQARAEFAHYLGQDGRWLDGDYATSPGEVWAENRSRCLGWHDGLHSPAPYTWVDDCAYLDDLAHETRGDAPDQAAAPTPRPPHTWVIDTRDGTTTDLGPTP